MRRAVFSIAGCLLLGSAALLPAEPLPVEQVGSKIAAAQLEDSAGRTRSTSEYAGKILVLVFWSFKCPVSLGYDARVAALEQVYRDRGVVVLGVDSNSNETPAEVQRNVENLKLRFPVLYDRDGALAERLGATHTPSVYILDGSSVLRYRGALDNNKQPGEAGRVAYAEEAISDLVAGRAPARPETREFGCTLKRRAR
jgi:peroxiredoxin